MLGFLQGKAIALVFAAIPVGAIAFIIHQQIKKFSGAVDKLPPFVHRGAVAAIALGLTTAYAAMGGSIECIDGQNCLEQLSTDKVKFALEWVLGTLSAFLIHAAKKGRK